MGHESSGIFGIILGAAEIAVGVLTAQPELVMAGIGTEIGAISTLLTKDPVNGTATTTRNSIAPWRAIYGETRVGGSLVFQNTFGKDDIILDLISVLACHQCESVDELLFDQQRVQLDYTRTAVGHTPYIGFNGASNYHSGTSFQPLNNGQTPYDITTITRDTNGLCTVEGIRNEAGTLLGIPFLQSGDKIIIQNVNLPSPNSALAGTLNGKFQVAQVLSYINGFAASFTFLNGGPQVGVSGPNRAGEVLTQWADYNSFVYFEWMDGTQQLGQTFSGAITGTPWYSAGSSGGVIGTLGLGLIPGTVAFVNLISPSSPVIAGGQATSNPWVPDTYSGTQNNSLCGKTAAFLRLSYRNNASGDTVFTGGIPQTSFHLYGNNQIFDPRTTATATTNGSGINSVTVTSTSSQYQFPCFSINVHADPRDTITTQAQLTPVMSPAYPVQGNGPCVPQNGMSLVGVTITHPGAGYVHPPVIRITSYTCNSALCIADYLCNQTWGFKLNYVTDSTSEGVPMSDLINSANICDEQVLRQDGSYESRYTCNGSFELSTKRGEVLEQLLTSCGGRLTTVGGQYKIHPAYGPADYPTTFPVLDLQSLAVGPIQWKSTVSVRDLINGVRGTYISSDNAFKSTDFPPYMQDYDHGYFGPSQFGGDINLAQDGGDRRWLDHPLQFTISYSMAQRLAKYELMKHRQFGSGTFICNMAAYNCVPLDIIEANCAILQWSNKQLEVSSVRLKPVKTNSSDGSDSVMLSVELDVVDIDSSVYQWNPGNSTTQGEELQPQGYTSAPLPTNVTTINQTLPFPWSPGYISGLAGDSITAPATFGMQPEYGIDAEGNSNVSLAISGYSPLNDLDTEVSMIKIACNGSSTGGTIPAGNYVVAMSAHDSGGSSFQNTNFLNFSYLTLTGTTSSIDVYFSFGSGDDNGSIFLAEDTGTYGAYVWHFQQSVSETSTSATITSFNTSTPGGSDALFSNYGVAWMHEIHAGLWDAQVQAVTSNTVTLAAPGMTSNQYAGYTLSLMAKYDGVSPTIVLNMPVASSTATDINSNVTFTIGANSLGVQLPDLTTLLAVSDWLIVRSNPTFTSNSYSDVNVANGYYPGGDTGVEAGHVAVVLSGVDAGDMQTIDSVSNDSFGNPTVYNLVGSWNIKPANGDIVVVCDPSTLDQFDTGPIDTSISVSSVIANVPVENLENAAWLFLVRTQDASGNYGPDQFAPMRDLILIAANSTRTVTS